MSYIPEIKNKISLLNSVVLTNVSGGTVWTGTGEDVTIYGRAGVSIWTPFGESCDGVLTIEVSRDGINWGGPNRTFADTSISQPHMWNIVEQYFRLKYTHGSTTASTLVIQTQYSVNADTILGHQLDEVLIDETESIVTKSVIIGKEPNGAYSNVRNDGYIIQTTTNLSGAGVYESSIISTEGFSQIQTELFSDQTGTLVGTWYVNSSGGTPLRTFTRPYSSSDISTGLVYFSSPIFAPYIKYTYTNDSIAQGSFYLGLKQLIRPISGQIIGLTDFIPNSVVANLGRNVLVGQDNAGNFKNVGVDTEGHIKMNIDEPLTAFGEMKIAEMTPILQITHPYEINYDSVSSGGTIGSGYLSYDSATTFVIINAGAATGSTGIMKSTMRAKYRNGQGFVVRFTCVFDTPVSGNTQFAGWGDSEDGFFFGYSGTTFGVCRRRNSIDYFIQQNEWSVDKFDGSDGLNNPSGELLNPQKGNVYEIQAQWLGFGAIRFNIESNDSGQFEPAHVIEYANENTIPSITNPSFPVLFECKNSTNNTNVVIKTPSMSAFVEGIIKYTGRNYSFSSAKATGTGTNMMTLQVPTTFKGKTNRSKILLKSISVVSDGVQSVTFRLIKNATLTGPSYTQTSTYSIVNYDTSATYTSSSGRVIYTIELNKSSNQTINIQELEFFVEAGETLSVIGDGNNAGSSVSLTWMEDI